MYKKRFHLELIVLMWLVILPNMIPPSTASLLPPVNMEKEFKIMKSIRLNATIPPLTIYKEMRGASRTAKLWVAWIIRNRAEHLTRWKDEPWEVCLEKAQFSAWGLKDSNLLKWPGRGALDTEAWRWCEMAWDTAQWGDRTQDPTLGSNHYHSFREPFDKRILKSWGAKDKPLTVGQLQAAYKGSVGRKIHAFKF